MKIIKPSVVINHTIPYKVMLAHVEASGRTCYKSEHKIDDDSAEPFISRLVRMGHHSVIEHTGVSVRFICDRGVTHELVRHRLCSFSQESTRYCCYSDDKFDKEITVIEPCYWDADSAGYRVWRDAMQEAERAYMLLLKEGSSPQEARSVLPNSLKSDIVVTANMRQWRAVLQQRVGLGAHPQAIQVATPLLGSMIEHFPVFFNDMLPMYQKAVKHFDDKGWKLCDVYHNYEYAA